MSLRRDVANPKRPGQLQASQPPQRDPLRAGPHFPMFRPLGPRERTRRAPVQQAVYW
jgi:hypothetical protein